MKKNTFLLILIFIFILSSCKSTDVIGNYAISTFSQVLNNYTHTNTENEQAIVFENGSELKLSAYGASIALPKEPFIKAGLNQEKLLRDTNSHIYISGEQIIIKGDTKGKSIKDLVEISRDKVGFHTKLDHYNIKIAEEFMFEWAKDFKTNELDIVFALDPMPFSDAGVTVTDIEGFIYKEVELEDKSKVFKLLYVSNK